MNAVTSWIEPQARTSLRVHSTFVQQRSPASGRGAGFDPERHAKIGVAYAQRVERGRRPAQSHICRRMGSRREIVGRRRPQRGPARVSSSVSVAGRIRGRRSAGFVEREPESCCRGRGHGILRLSGTGDSTGPMVFQQSLSGDRPARPVCVRLKLRKLA